MKIKAANGSLEGLGCVPFAEVEGVLRRQVVGGVRVASVDNVFNVAFGPLRASAEREEPRGGDAGLHEIEQLLRIRSGIGDENAGRSGDSHCRVGVAVGDELPDHHSVQRTARRVDEAEMLRAGRGLASVCDGDNVSFLLILLLLLLWILLLTGSPTRRNVHDGAGSKTATSSNGRVCVTRTAVGDERQEVAISDTEKGTGGIFSYR